MKRSKTKSKGWQDHWTRKAQKENYPARSAYKLEEIQRKFNVIASGGLVLDLGCAPGSWLLLAARAAGVNGRVLGIDVKAVEINLPPNVITLVADINEPDEQIAQLMSGPFDTVLSDMAPATTGNKFVDAVRSARLASRALAIASQGLRSGGNFVCKIFQGEDFKPFTDEVRRLFKHQHNFKPRSSRKASKEIFVIGLSKK